MWPKVCRLCAVQFARLMLFSLYCGLQQSFPSYVLFTFCAKCSFYIVLNCDTEAVVVVMVMVMV